MQNFQAATVTSAGALPVPEASSVAAVLGQDIYLFGGSASSTIYELSGTSFSAVGRLPTVTADAAVAADGEIIVAGGTDEGLSAVASIYAVTPLSP